MPPKQWITSTKTHQTRILGTLIFENDSIEDLQLLIRGHQSLDPSIPSQPTPAPSNYYINLSKPFDSISTYFADRLIDLAIHHQFHGWLINIELDLRDSIPTQSLSIVHAIKIWVEYLRKQGQLRVGSDWEVCWYDSISYLDGSLFWQSQLHPEHNLPFFSAASSIFLDYHWNSERISATLAVVDNLISKQSIQGSLPVDESLSKLSLDWSRSLDQKALTPKQLKRSIFFGVDVYGRGCPYGGGFSSWKAASDILRAGFSVALFAPGWTWESDSLHQDRASSQEFEAPWRDRWWRDERYFWTGLLEPSMPTVDEDKEGACLQLSFVETPNVYLDSLRISTNYQQPRPTRGAGFSELPQHTPFLKLFPVRKTQVTSSFYTNWSLGSGRGFWVDGQLHFDDQFGIKDWSDAAMSFPINDLSIGGGNIWTIENRTVTQTGLARCDPVVDAGWFGSGGIELEEPRITSSSTATIKYVWINTTSILCEGEKNCRLVWRPRDSNDGLLGSLGMVFQTSDLLNHNSLQPDSQVSVDRVDSSLGPSMVAVAPSSPQPRRLEIYDIQTRELERGWFESSCRLKSSIPSTVVTRIGICLSSNDRFSHYLGEISVVPSLPSDHQNVHGSKDTHSRHSLSVAWEPSSTVDCDRPTIQNNNITVVPHVLGENRLISGQIKWEYTNPSTHASLGDPEPLVYLVYISSYTSEDDQDKINERLVGIVRGLRELNLDRFILSDFLRSTAENDRAPSGEITTGLVVVKGKGMDGMIKCLGKCPLS